MFQAVTAGEKIYLRPSDPSLFTFIVALHPLQFLQHYTCVMLPEIMLKRVQARTSTMERQQVFMKVNSARDKTQPGKLVINTSKQCQKSVMDSVVMHSSQHKKLASTICELSMEDHVVPTR